MCLMKHIRGKTKKNDGTILNNYYYYSVVGNFKLKKSMVILCIHYLLNTCHLSYE